MSSTIPDSFELRGRAFTGLDDLPRDEARRLYTDAVQSGTACGCGAGAIGAGLAGSLYLVGLPLTLTIGAAVVGGLLGKCLGMWWSRRRFAAASRQLELALDARVRR